MRDLAGLVVSLLSWTAAQASDASDPCLRDERVVFSCAVAKGKVVSLCRSAGARPADGSLVYRFGRPGQPELVFPQAAAGSLQQFRYAHYFRAQVDRTELSFETATARYSIYDYYEGDQKPSRLRGVRVGIGDRDLELKCVGPVVSRLVELEDVVPCDADNALASCEAKPSPMPSRSP